MKKYAKNKFIPELEARGFKYHSGLEFSRIVGEDICQIISGGVSRGENLRFDVTCFVKEYDPKLMEKFPKNIPLTCGGGLGENMISPEVWDVADEESIEEALDSVLNYIDKYAIPWLDSVTTRQEYINNLFPHLKEKIESEGRLESILSPSD
jgi:hypothetical protein